MPKLARTSERRSFRVSAGFSVSTRETTGNALRAGAAAVPLPLDDAGLITTGAGELETETAGFGDADACGSPSARF
ncbi:MAG: hypothetical protein ACRD4I_17055, partial [Candidatus Angelobacter sp.]